jgi:hypothetical protein
MVVVLLSVVEGSCGPSGVFVVASDGDAGDADVDGVSIDAGGWAKQKAA